MGAALLVNAGEPVKPEAARTTPETAATTTATNTAPAPTLTAAEKIRAEKVGERLARGEAVTKAPPTPARSLMQSLNPFAPVEKAPDTPWLSRVAWSTAAEKAVKNSEPIEMRHESSFGVVIVSR